MWTRGRGWTSALCLFAGLAGCVVDDEDGKLVILQAQPLLEGECAVSTDERIGLGGGVIDLAMATDYTLHLLMRNNMGNINAVKGFTPRDGRLNTTDVRLTRAVIEYRALDQITVSFPDSLRIPLSANVGAGTTAVFGMQVLTPAMVQDLRTSPEFMIRSADGNLRPARTSVQLLVNVTVQGETLDGKAVETSGFVFPITVCNGCLVTVPPDAVNTEAGIQPNCLRIDPDLNLGDNLCHVGRDEPVDCRVCTLFAVDDFARQLCQPIF